MSRRHRWIFILAGVVTCWAGMFHEMGRSVPDEPSVDENSLLVSAGQTGSGIGQILRSDHEEHALMLIDDNATYYIADNAESAELARRLSRSEELFVLAVGALGKHDGRNQIAVSRFTELVYGSALLQAPEKPEPIPGAAGVFLRFVDYEDENGEDAAPPTRVFSNPTALELHKLTTSSPDARITVTVWARLRAVWKEPLLEILQYKVIHQEPKE